MFSGLTSSPAKVSRHERIRLMHLQGLDTTISSEIPNSAFVQVFSPGISQFIDYHDTEDNFPISPVTFILTATSEGFHISTPTAPLSAFGSTKFEDSKSHPMRLSTARAVKRRRRQGQLFERSAIPFPKTPLAELAHDNNQSEVSDDENEILMPTFPFSATSSDISFDDDDIYSNFDDPAIDEIEFEILTRPTSHLAGRSRQPQALKISEKKRPSSHRASALHLSRVPETVTATSLSPSDQRSPHPQSPPSSSFRKIPTPTKPIVSPLSTSFILKSYSDTSSSLPQTPITPLPLSTAERRQRRMDKLTRTLGERVPSDLIRTPVANQLAFNLGHVRSFSDIPTRTVRPDVLYTSKDIQASFRCPDSQGANAENEAGSASHLRSNSAPSRQRRNTLKKLLPGMKEKSQHAAKRSIPGRLNLCGSTGVDSHMAWGKRKEREWSGEWNLPDYKNVVRELRILKAN